MKQYLKLAAIALGIGLVLTGVSFVRQSHGQESVCTVKHPGPLDELGFDILHERGWPWPYYREGISKGCHPYSPNLEPVGKASWPGPMYPALLADIGVWSVVGGLAVFGLLRHKSNKRHGSNSKRPRLSRSRRGAKR